MGSEAPSRTDRIKVLYLVESMEIAGAEHVVLSLLSRLDRERFHPVVGCLVERGPLASELERLGVEVVALGKRPGLDLSALFRLKRLMQQQQIHIVHTHVWNADVWGRIAAKLAGVPIIVTTQHNVCNWKKRRHLLVDRLLSLVSDQQICVSDAVESFYRERAGIAPRRLVRVYNGISTAPFEQPMDRARKRDEIGVEPHNVVLTAVGRLIPQKGHCYFLEAMKRVRQKHPEAVAWLVGDGALRSELEAQSRELGLDDGGVMFLGQRRDVAELLLASDLFVLPSSLREGLSLSLLEGMAAGLAAVVTDVGGNSEALEEGVTGFVVPPADAEALTTAIVRLLDDPELLSRMGQAARKLMHDRFSLDAMVSEYARLYELHAARKLGPSLAAATP